VNFAERYGPWAVIAGASEGTGRSFAEHLAARGINCILIARRPGPLNELAAELRARHRVACISACIDLAARDALSHVVAATGGREVGLFINNAGSDTNDSRFLDCAIDNWELLVDRNVMNPMRMSHHFGKLMRDRGHGGIILVGSGACYGGATGMAVYAGSKAFDLCFGEGLWAELRPHGVHVLNLILGRTNTPMFRAFMERRGLPVGEGAAEPDDVAKLGLERLPHGPVQNWGAADDQPGFAPISAAARRERILNIEAASNNLFKAK
jgi:short-subunit dehydrogenase